MTLPTRKPVQKLSVAARAKTVVTTATVCAIVAFASFMGIKSNASTPPSLAVPALSLPPQQVIVKVVYVTVPSTSTTPQTPSSAPVAAATPPKATYLPPATAAVAAPPLAVAKPTPALTSRTSH